MNELAKALSKPVEKLIDVFSKWAWTAYKPKSIRNEADAEAYKIEVLAKAEAKKIMIEWEAQISIRERAQARLWNQEINRQENLENIAEKSINHLPESVNDEPVDEDWRTRFFNKAQDVSSEDMQEIWAKILAEEISTPWKISIRTLEILSNITKKEAELFWILITLSSSNEFIYKINWYDFEKFGLDFSNLISLEDAWLIKLSDLQRQWWSESLISEGKIAISIWNKKYSLKFKWELPILFQTLEFTSTWWELCKSLSPKLNNDFIHDIIDFMTHKWYLVEEL